MRIKQDLIEVVPATHIPETGEKLEPEERPAQRTVVTDGAPVRMNTQGLTSSSVVDHLQHDTKVSIEGTAGEFAQGLRVLCGGCAYFDRDAWGALKRQWDNGDMMHRRQLNHMRGMLLESQNAVISGMHTDPNDGDMDVEHALGAMGLCRAMQEIFKDAVIVHPMAGCPDTIRDAQGRTPYKPRNREVAERSAEAYDSIMDAAMGRRA